jgi:hypothetical protein
MEDLTMAVVAINEIKGDPQELLAKYDKVNAKLMERGEPAPGLLVHTCIVLDDGIRIANVWNTEQEARDGFRNEDFQAALRGGGFEPEAPQIHRVHNQLNFAAMRAAAPVA